MKRSDVWTEIHRLPLRLKFQRESDGTIVAQLPGYVLRAITVTGDDMSDVLRQITEHMEISA